MLVPTHGAHHGVHDMSNFPRSTFLRFRFRARCARCAIFILFIVLLCRDYQRSSPKSSLWRNNADGRAQKVKQANFFNIFRTSQEVFPRREASIRQTRPTLVVGIITRGSNEDHNNIEAARRTWLKHTPAERIIILSSRADNRINSTKSLCEESYSLGVCCKVSELFALMYERIPNAHWYLRATDDSFWHINLLLARLQGFDSTARHLLGCVGIVKGKAWLRHGNGEPHPTGGSGYIMSNALASWCYVHQQSFLLECWHDELSIGHYLRQVLGLVTIHLHGILQEPQLRESMPLFHSVNECNCPLPPPLYYNTGADERLAQGYAVLYPFSPYTWEEALSWHAKAKFWKSLVALSEELNRHRARGPEFANDTLLIFIETDSVINGTYETLPSYAMDPTKHPELTRKQLAPSRPSVCLLKPYMRLLSYHHCNISTVDGLTEKSCSE